MNARFAGWIARERAGALAALLGQRGIEVRDEDRRVWLRTEAADDALGRGLARIDFGARFERLDDDSLVHPAGRIPRGRLGDEGWMPLEEWIEASLPSARIAPRPQGVVKLELRRGGEEREASGLVLEFGALAAWTEQASALRAAALRFALAADGRALVIGAPLPALPGARYVLDGTLLLPCGFELLPRVGAACVQAVLALGAGELALFAEDGGFESLPEPAFLPLGRGAIAASAQAAGE